MSDEYVERLIELPRRVVHQPTPDISLGGDCGACCLAGLLDWSVEDVYLHLHPSKKPTPFSWPDMASALQTATWDLGKLDHYVERSPSWPVDASRRAWGDTSWLQSMEWRDYLEVAFRAGYYAITQVVIKEDGPVPPGGGTNHWLMLCGLRLFWEKSKGSEHNSGQYQVLVSCSSRTTPDLEWVEIGPFLQKRGGFAVMLAKPTLPRCPETTE